MKINNIQINHLHEPLGFQLSTPLMISAELLGTTSKKVERHLTISKDAEIIYDSGNEQDKTNLLFSVPVKLQPRTHYDVTIMVHDGEKITKQQSWFETGYIDEPLQGQWIADSQTDRKSVIFHKHFKTEDVEQARLYITALGVYEINLDGQKIGTEYLAPGFTDYDYYVQRSTYDLTSLLQQTGEHDLQIMVGSGWYRGKLGLKKHGGLPNNYGDILMAVADLRLKSHDGHEQIITTDEDWDLQQSSVVDSGIYYGEDLDETISPKRLGKVEIAQPISRYVKDRLSLPIQAHERFSAKLITTPQGDHVLDFGQNLAGWVSFYNRLPAGNKVKIEYGEILQNGEFYRDNLRSARGTFTYVSDGNEHWVRPHFTYFGFRYARITGFDQVNPADFQSIAIYSSMPATGWLKTDNPTVNRLFENVKWGQRSNFVDIPTDCPQRDERLGWTGDAAIFAKTASYNMDTYEFFKKYSFDMAVEQSKFAGKLPLYVPSVGETDGGKAVWSDAAVIIPWQTYQRSGDPAILRQNIGAMMSWVDFVHDRAVEQGNEYLWLSDDQLGDWLALDTEDIMHLKGKTSDDLIASAFYYYSATIVAKAAQVLAMQHEYQYYHQLAKLIKKSFLMEFFTQTGRTLANSQTGLALCICFGLYPEGERKKLTHLLVDIIEKNHNHLSTGFVGTPFLLPALSQNGENDLAVRLFLNNDFPSWLYEVKHGATTIWERWDSVDEQGKIAQNGMNSLNHYSSGAVMQWAYEELLGLHQQENNLLWHPRLTPAFKQVQGQFSLPVGLVQASWQIKKVRQVQLKISVPFGARVKVELPATKQVIVDGVEAEGPIELVTGSHSIDATVIKPLIQTYNCHTPLKKYCHIKTIVNQLEQKLPFWGFLTAPGNMERFKAFSLYQLNNEMRGIGFQPLNDDELNEVNQIFQEYTLKQIRED